MKPYYENGSDETDRGVDVRSITLVLDSGRHFTFESIWGDERGVEVTWDDPTKDAHGEEAA